MTEYEISINRVKESDIKRIVSISKDCLKDYRIYKGTRLPFDWRNYNAFFVEYTKKINVNYDTIFSFILLYETHEEEIELIKLLNTFPMKEFLIKDKSGRGESTVIDDKQLITWDNEEDDNEQLLHDFIDEADFGDIWETHNIKIIRVK